MSSALELLDPRLRRWITDNWAGGGLSAIQREAIPVIRQGRNCVIEAPTAGGKTEACLFPLLSMSAERCAHEALEILYVAPLRALLNNLEIRAIEYSETVGLHAFKWHGDVANKRKHQALREPPTLLLTTPESLEATLLVRGGADVFFSSLRAVVIDEAHNFADNDRGGHLLSVINRITRYSKHPVQRIAMTATIGNPEAMKTWLCGDDECQSVKVSGAKKERDYEVCFFDEELNTPARIDEGKGSSERLLRSLASTVAVERSIVFVGSRKNAEGLANALPKVPEGRKLELATHHSNVSRYFREDAESRIQSRNEDGLNAIISTSTLELGIDIGELRAVAQVGALASSSAFLQRVGRTGRRPNRPRFFRGYCTKVEELILLSAVVSLGLKEQAEALRLPTRAFHLLAHQLMCLSLEKNGITKNDAFEVLTSCHAFSGVDRADFSALVDFMCEKELLRFTDNLLIMGDAGARRYQGGNWRSLFAVFSSAPLFDVIHGREQVGTLDSGFVESQSLPFAFVLAGRRWLSSKVDMEARIVKVKPAPAATEPKWKGFSGPSVPYETAQEAGRLLSMKDPPAFLDDEAQVGFRRVQSYWSSIQWQEGRAFAVCPGVTILQLVTFAGDAINRTLAELLKRIDGVQKASAEYHQIELGVRPNAEAEAVLAAIHETWARIGDEDYAALQRRIDSTAPTWLASPFAKCVPEHLTRIAAAERAFDVRGLQAFVRHGPIIEA